MTQTSPAQSDRAESANWGAVFALAVCAGTLVASEFMPAGLLTPIAAALHMTDGQTGRAITISGVFAVLTSLGISPLTRGLDRRWLLLFVVGLMVVSNLLVGMAPNVATLMVGRALIGIVIGTFWSMSTATVMRLVPNSDIPKGVGIVNAGNALAGVIGAPLGSFLGQYIGWRGSFFFLLVPLASLAFFWLYIRLPTMPSERTLGGGSVFGVLRNRQFALGLLGAMVFFLGQFALTTYLRPFLETVTHINTSTFSLIQLTMGLMGLLGNLFVGVLLRKRLYSLLAAIPVLQASIALALIVSGSLPLAAGVLLAVWGFISTAAPAVWWTWLSKILPQDAEVGGGLLVAVIQLAVASGSTVGGILYDQSGYKSTFTFTILALCVASLLAVLSWQAGKRSR